MDAKLLPNNRHRQCPLILWNIGNMRVGSSPLRTGRSGRMVVLRPVGVQGHIQGENIVFILIQSGDHDDDDEEKRMASQRQKP